MSRVEVIGLATLHLGDCREIAPTLPRPAAVISDPPYGMDFRSNHRIERHSAIANDNSEAATRCETASSERPTAISATCVVLAIFLHHNSLGLCHVAMADRGLSRLRCLKRDDSDYGANRMSAAGP